VTRAATPAWAIAGLLALVPAPEPAPAARTGDGTISRDDTLQIARVRQIVARGHAWMIKQQNRDGSFSVERAFAGQAAPVAVTALAALSLMAAGNLPDRGEHDRVVRAAVDWLVDHCDESGYFTTDSDSISKMHGHGYALLALTQACGMSGDDTERRRRMREAIERGVRLIETSQGETGGWWYDPKRSSDHEGSVTVCMVQALRAARDAGFAVDKGVIERAVQYLKRSQEPESGRFRYRINDPSTSWALTAAALATLNATGDYGSELVRRGFEALQESDPFTGGAGFEAFRDYGALYAAQAYWQHPDRSAFDRWWPEFVRECEVDRQQPDGDFEDRVYGNVYATAIVTLTLQVPVGYLPLFQR
jgi:hypothetical protein